MPSRIAPMDSRRSSIRWCRRQNQHYGPTCFFHDENLILHRLEQSLSVVPLTDMRNRTFAITYRVQTLNGEFFPRDPVR